MGREHRLASLCLCTKDGERAEVRRRVGWNGNAPGVDNPCRLSKSARETIMQGAGAPTGAEPEGGVSVVLMVAGEPSWKGVTPCPSRENAVPVLSSRPGIMFSDKATSRSKSGG